MLQPNALVHSLASIISAFYLLQKLKKKIKSEIASFPTFFDQIIEIP